MRASACPHHQHQRPRGFRRKGQPPAGGQVIGARLRPEFDQHGAQAWHARAFKPGLKRRHGVFGAHEEDAGGIQPPFGKAGWRGQAFFHPAHVMADP